MQGSAQSPGVLCQRGGTQVGREGKALELCITKLSQEQNRLKSGSITLSLDHAVCFFINGA